MFNIDLLRFVVNAEILILIMYIFHSSFVGVYEMNRIRQLRQQIGWTQEDLAKRLNVSYQAIGHYETGARSIDANLICTLCEIFECTADYLLCRSSNPKSSISDADAMLLQAYHGAPPSVVTAINALLQPYQKESEADQVM